MLVIQELTDIDGIEHKPLRITGDQDRIEVRDNALTERKWKKYLMKTLF